MCYLKTSNIVRWNNDWKYWYLFGFKNHLWNGITTRHFGKIVSILITKKIKIPNTIHIVPSDVVNKFELLKIFQKRFIRHDLKINKTNANIVVDRTLKSSFMDINKKINEALDFKKSPSIKQLINALEENKGCLNDLKYVNKSGQERKVSKTAIKNITEFLLD